MVMLVAHHKMAAQAQKEEVSFLYTGNSQCYENIIEFKRKTKVVQRKLAVISCRHGNLRRGSS
jgi:hypothetical protein